MVDANGGKSDRCALGLLYTRCAASGSVLTVVAVELLPR